MSEFDRHTGLSTCLCPECMLIHSGAIDRGWDGFRWAWLAGEGRVAVMLLTQRLPVHSAGPRQDWAGCIPWLDRAGVSLVFDEEDHDE